MISINKIILAIPGCLFYIGVSAQVLDVQHYRYSIELSDKHDTIYGKAEIVVKFIHPSAYAEFDLVQPKENGKGMMVLHASGTHLRGLDRNKETEKIKLLTKKTYQPGDTAHFTIHYKGIPADGLIISKTKFGQRSFFADNWPDRGHNWLPCHDDPADKASVEFIVTAPLHYQVVANGLQVEETNLPGDRKLTHWRETVPISTKVMVIGVADFAVHFAGMVEPGIPVYSWVYPQDREKGFYDYSLALEILPYYIKNIGPYPYHKLANVQSKTSFGGLENANTIFYSEGSVTGTRSAEILLAHEIAHQWFGNHATEKAFAHLWLSEGFATYMTILYMENKYGKDTASVMLTEDRRQVIDFARGNNNLVIDSTHDYMQLLNPNSYQKGGWILHMLRRELGDSVFWRSIRKYFASFGGGTANSKDLQDVFEKISGKNLGEFFNQWLLQPGIPVLSVTWNYIPLQKKLQVKVEQLQNGPAFSFPLEIEIKDRAKSSRTEKLKITSKSQNFSLPAGTRPAEIKLDPHISRLFAGTIAGNLNIILLQPQKNGRHRFSPHFLKPVDTLTSRMLIKTFGSAVYGVEAILITIEVNWMDSGKDPTMVGLPDNAVKESMQRIESTFKTNGYRIPRTKVMVNLAPADIKKSGTAFDLPIAIGILAASEQIPNAGAAGNYIIMGELSLDGKVRSIKGALPIAIQAKKENFKGLILPKSNAREAGLVNNIQVYGVSHINEVIEFFEKGERGLEQVVVNTRDEFFHSQYDFEIDFSDVKGQENIKRALEITAAGGHNAILIGPPGAGKTMLAKRLPTILPPLSLQEALETTKIHSVAGKLNEHSTLVARRPFRSPHHTISDVALVGGGGIPQPGEISLAHNGVLFLDELPEFKRTVLEVMRQPMEERKVTISRAKVAVDFPASFMLIASMNPCPCGFYNHPERDCSCPPGAVQKYLNKISGPLLDRIDLHVEVTPVPFQELSKFQEQEQSCQIRERVLKARDLQAERYKNDTGVYCNAQINSKTLRQICVINSVGQNLLKSAMEKLNLSARAYDRILKVSRTIADLAQCENIQPEHLAEAIQYRSLDREGWGGK